MISLRRFAVLASVVALLLGAVVQCGGEGDGEPSTPTPIPMPTPESPTPEDREATPVSLEEAAQSVLAEVVRPDDLDHEVIVFPWPEPLKPGDRLQSYLSPDHESPGEAFPIGDEAWFFWVDDAPGAAFVHPTRFVFVDRATGELSSSEEEWWPVLNGEGLWVETEVYWDEANWAFSNVEWRPSRLDESAHPRSLAKPLPHPALQDAAPGAGLVVNGWNEGQTLKEDMQTSAQGMHQSLSAAGFDTEYVGPPGAPATQAAIRSWILHQSIWLRPSQTAFIYIAGHGSEIEQQGLIDIGEELLVEPDLAGWLTLFDPGVHVIVVIDSCYSGSFINSLRQVADVTITSTGAHDYMYCDFDPRDEDGKHLDKNPGDEGLEFSSGLIEGWNQIMGDPAARERVDARAEQNDNENFWTALAAESYLIALEKDACYQLGWTFPNMVRMIPVPEVEIVVAPELQTTVLFLFPDEIGDVVNIDTGEPAGPGGQDPDISAAMWLTSTPPISGVVGVEFATELTQEAKVAIGFYNPEYPLPEVSHDAWYPDTVANLYFLLHIVPPNTVHPSVRFFSNSQWMTAHPRLQAWTDLMAVYLVLAWDELLMAWPGFTPWDWAQAAWFAAASDGTSCDHVGLEEDEEDVGIEPVVPLLHQYWGEPQREEEEAPPPEEPTPEPGAALPGEEARSAVETLLGVLDDAWRARVFPADTVYPGVWALFREDQCEPSWEASYGTDSPYFLPEEILSVTDPGDWTWLIGEHSLRVSDTYTVTGEFFNEEQGTFQGTFHVAWVAGPPGWVGWFPNCREDLPPSPEPPPVGVTCPEIMRINAPSWAPAHGPFGVEIDLVGELPPGSVIGLQRSQDQAEWQLLLPDWWQEGGHFKAVIDGPGGEGLWFYRLFADPCYGEIHEMIHGTSEVCQ